MGEQRPKAWMGGRVGRAQLARGSERRRGDTWEVPGAVCMRQGSRLDAELVGTHGRAPSRAAPRTALP